MTTDVRGPSSAVRVLPQLFIASGAGTTTRTGAPGSSVWVGAPAVEASVAGAQEAHWPRSSQIAATVTGGGLAWSVLRERAPGSGVEIALSRFAARVAPILDVVAVSHAAEGGVQRLWTFIPRRDKALRRCVYLEEIRLMEEFPDILFDFNVVALEDLPHGALVPDDLQGRIVLFRRNA